MISKRIAGWLMFALPLFVLVHAGSACAQNNPPMINLSVMTSGSSGTTPASITLTSDASDDGSIAKVEFFSGATLLATITSPPYTYVWAGVPAGMYTLTGKATDNLGATASATIPDLLVNNDPEVTLTAPASGTVVTAPGTIAMSATATDDDGSISKVEFYSGSTLLATVATPPYAYTWTNVPGGSYSIKAKATDNLGTTITSNSRTVIVNAVPTVTLTAPANGATYAQSANVTLSATASDTDGSISKVEFYNGPTLLFSDTSTPYSYTWSAVPTGNYTVTAKTTDNRGAVTTSSAVTITVGSPGAAPTVSVTLPSNGAVFTAPASITLNANANDSDGSIAKVEFFRGSTLLGTVISAPYTFAWNNAAAGTYSITAKATDNQGQATTSAPVSITVNAPPTVSLTSPANGAEMAPPATVTLAANASDSDGSIAKVDFYNGAALVGTATAAPYTATWSNVSAGTYSLTARATDDRGAVTISSARSITVATPNVLPTVTLTAPSSGAVIQQSAGVTFNATASDSDGTIAKVEFLDGALIVGTVMTPPYIYTWASPSAGSRVVVARATDNRGGVTTSTAATINVNATPTVGLSTTTSSSTAPADITMTAAASDGDGSIVKVEFFNGATLLATDATAPYSFVWSSVTAGTYTVTAKVTDNLGGTNSSSIVVTLAAYNASPTISLSSPAHGSSFGSPGSVPFSATASDSDGSVAKVEFFDGGTLLATVLAPPYTYTWNNPPLGSHAISAKATDNLGKTTSTASATVAVNSNTAPTVSLTAPANGAMAYVPASITLTASATDSNGIAKVEFYDGATLLATVNASPYTYTWNNAALGSHTISAKAADSFGLTTTSTPITITVNGNLAPTISLTAPANGATVYAPASITLTAGATDSDGIAKVEFYDGATLLATVNASPYTYTWNNAALGSHTISAKATDSLGNTATSSVATISILGNSAPTVSLTAPADGAQYLAPASISLGASVSDVEGNVSKVEFYNGSSLIGTATTAPYSFTWPNIAQGTYTLKARATDQGGAVTESATATVSVGPAFTPPGGQTSSAPAGTTPGAAGVDPQGAATYAIPIQVPPGTAGMAPALSLNYSSRAGNGMIGVGWSLGGFSVISRCPRTMAQDGTAGSVNLDANDRFCLDGQRLVAVSGVYGADGTEYRTEIESFAKVVSYGTAGTGPLWFKVWTRAGQVIEYGNTTNSRIEAKSSTTVRAWAANKVSDTKGNYLTLTYTEDTTNGQFYPSRIDYTGNTAAALATYNSVQFTYQTRTDAELTYIAGKLVKTVQRLTNIKTYNGATVVRDYRLAYAQAPLTKRSRLTSVTECDSASNCLPATTFAWQGDSALTVGVSGNAASGFTDAAGWNDGLRYFSLDINGDGKGDILARDAAGNLLSLLSNGSTLVQAANTANTGLTDAAGYNSGLRYFAMDVNADGKGDLVTRDGAGNLTTWLSDGSRFTAAGTTATGWSDGGGWNDGLRYFVLDINGDGRSDMVSRDAAGTFYTWLSDGTRFALATTTSTALTDAAGYNSGDRFFTLDVNGDGRSDLVVRTPNGDLQIWLSNGAGFTLAGSTSADLDDSEYATGMHLFVMDVNGDGKADIVARSSGGRLESWLSTGASFVSGGSVSTDLADFSGWNVGLRYFVVDANGDGKMDLVGRDDDGDLKVYLSNGTTFSSAVTLTTDLTDAAGWNSGLRFFAQDIHGDGKGDIVARSPDGTWRVFAFGSAGLVPDLLKSATNGLGAVAEVGYKPLTDPAVYTKGSGTTYPLVDVQGPLYVVAEARASDGVGGLYRTTYTYAGARSHLQGRGFLGFASVTAQDPQSGLTSRTDYRQDYPFIGSPTLASQAAASPLFEASATYAATDLGGTRRLPYSDSATEKRWDLNGAFLSRVSTTTQIDAYGNPTQIATVSQDVNGTADGNRRTVVNTFSNDPATWLLGRLTGTAVTHTLPDNSSQTRTQAFVYDAAGLLTQAVVEPGNPSLKLITAYGYDAFGNRTSATVSSDAAAPAAVAIVSRTATLTFDSKGQFPVTAKNPLNHTETRTFNAHFGTLASLTGPNGLQTTWTYDAFGRPLTETTPDGTRRTTTYARCANCWQRSALSVETTHQVVTSGATVAPPSKTFLDTLGRPLLTQATAFDGSPSYQEREYDPRGRLSRVSLPHYASGAPVWTAFVYDDLNRLLSQTAPDGSRSQLSYNGLSTDLTDAKGQTTRRLRNRQGQVVEIHDAANGTLAYTYDAAGQITRITDPAGNRSTLAYDGRGRRISLTDPDSGTTTSTVDVLGQLLSQTDAKAQTTSAVYDKLGRLVQRAEADLVSAWYYDTGKGGAACAKGIGKLCEAEAANGYRRVHGYDNLGRLASLSTTIDTAYTASFTYDSAGRPATVTYPTGFAVKSVYNARGYLAELRHNASNALYWRADASTAAGQLSAYTLGNGLAGSSGYDALTGRLESQTLGAVQALHTTYDAVGNLVERRDDVAGLTETFTYDALDRLTQHSLSGATNATLGFAYDALGNLTYKSDVGSYAYPASGPGSVRPHAVAAITGTVNGVTNPSFAYDANGNLQSGAGRSFTWTSFDLPSRISRGSTQLDFTYGPEHQRLRQVSPSATTIYLSAPHYEKETQTSGLIVHKHYLHAGGRLVGLYSQRSNGQHDTRYFATDHLGSVSVVTDEAGAVVERLAYDAWGKRRNANGSGDPGNALRPAFDRGYTGHEQLDEGGMGLIHMNGRVYDPAIGRFTAPDPLVQAPGFSQSYNRYSYVWNNPLGYTDPSGFALSISVTSFSSCCEVPLSLRDTVADYCNGYANCQTQFVDGLGFPVGNGVLGNTYSLPGTTDPSNSGLGTYLPGSTSIFANGSAYFSPGSGGTASGSMTQSTTTTSTSSSTSTSTTVTYSSSVGSSGCTATSCSGNTVSGVGSGQTGGGNAGASGGGIFAAGATGMTFGQVGQVSLRNPSNSLTYPATGEGDAKPWGGYLPGTEAGDSAAQYWADLHVQTGNPLYAVPGAFASLWTPDTALDTAFTLGTAGGGSALGQAAGPLKQWVRIGPSYSKAGQFQVDMSIRWGASPAGGGKYIQQIPSPSLQNFNQWLRSQQAPVGGWRAADPGHFHLWR